MSWVPQPGDRVTSPLLVGEWEVCRGEGGGRWLLVHERVATVSVHHAYLTPVAPPLPPEPAVGSVVRAHGRLWQRQERAGGGPHWWCPGQEDRTWSHLATADDLSPVVPVDDVADWLASLSPVVPVDDVADWLASTAAWSTPASASAAVRAKFGWWEK